MPWMDWYNALAKPSWTPAPATIGLIWTILFAAVIASCAVSGHWQDGDDASTN